MLFNLVSGLALSSLEARASGVGGMMEDQTSIPNGNGVSTPSFWDGMSGQNPAGMSFNTTFKVQGTAAAFDSKLSKPKESGGILGGNGLIGAGLEWSKYNTGPITGNGSLANWAVAGRLAAIHSMFGFSGHYSIPGGVGNYDAGTLIDLSRSLRFGAMVTDFTNGLHVVAAGLNYTVMNSVDAVVDGAYRIQNNYGIVKPGLSYHHGFFQFSGAYGVRLVGQGEVFVSSGWSGAIAVRLTHFLLVEYEYQTRTLHRLGLTLRWN